MGSEGAQAPGTHIPDMEWGKVTAQAVQEWTLVDVRRLAGKMEKVRADYG